MPQYAPRRVGTAQGAVSAHLLPEVGAVVLERTLARGVSGGLCSETPVFPQPGKTNS